MRGSGVGTSKRKIKYVKGMKIARKADNESGGSVFLNQVDKILKTSKMHSFSSRKIWKTTS